MVRIYLSMLVSIVLGCGPSEHKSTSNFQKHDSNQSFALFSPSVGDSFSIKVSVPEEIKEKPFPVVFLLDANLYFEPMAAICRKYAEVGLLPPVVLVGVGYKDFATMDSLRHRDYTFPKALPRYEMAVSGGGIQFARFLSEELASQLESRFPIDTSKKVLMGHSLGGFYTMFHFWKAGQVEVAGFKGYIAASPSLDYDDSYLLQAFKKTGSGKENASLFVTFGGLEDAENKDDPDFIASEVILKQLQQSIGNTANVRLKTETYSNLGHMDTPMPSFIKGLQEILMKDEEKP